MTAIVILRNKMADEEAQPKQTVTKKRALPPLSTKSNEEGDVDKPQVTRRKKKKPVETVENGNATGEGDKPTPRRRARSATPAGKKMSGADGDGTEDATVTTPKKKKRKPKPKPEGGDQAEEAPVSDKSAVNMPEVSRFKKKKKSISFGCNAAFIHVWSGIK